MTALMIAYKNGYNEIVNLLDPHGSCNTKTIISVTVATLTLLGFAVIKFAFQKWKSNCEYMYDKKETTDSNHSNEKIKE